MTPGALEQLCAMRRPVAQAARTLFTSHMAARPTAAAASHATWRTDAAEWPRISRWCTALPPDLEEARWPWHC
ncbi:hypothetical protein [Streptomyces sp. NPDC001404]|uniref:hypothetical protein n=1 Tax=Streptomyces sp. NPDC001404 TaxID=3364571 RepID=UPI0036CB538B